MYAGEQTALLLSVRNGSIILVQEFLSVRGWLRGKRAWDFAAPKFDTC